MKYCPRCRQQYGDQQRFCSQDRALLSLPNPYRLVGFERTAVLLRQIAAVLDKAHTARSIHRDLKPANIMLVERDDGREQVKVLDFGIAKVLSATTGALVSRVMGTPHYASPEQWKPGAVIDGRADIYALGVMLYQMLTAVLPFNADCMEELIQLKLASAPPALRFLRPDAPAAVEELLTQMMAREPSQRPPRISEVPKLFAAALRSTPQPEPPTIITPQPPAGAEAETTLLEPLPERTSAPTIQDTRAAAGMSTFEFVTGTVNEYGKIIERRNGKAQ